MMRKLLLYFHTIKHLHFKQVLYRVWFKYKKKSVFTALPANAFMQVNLAIVTMPFLLNDKHYFINNKICLMNKASDFNSPVIWNDPSKDKLWLYNLHYFDALLSSDVSQQEKAVVLLGRWVSENPPFKGNGWEPYPISLRITNCIKFALMGKTLTGAVKRSVYLQARYLRSRCEFHLLGNHLFENLKALCFAGLFYKTIESDQWFQFAMKHLMQQVKEQVLPDGGHFELSPMYHGIILEGMLDLNNLFNLYHKNFPWQQQTKLMLDWLQYMIRPNNEYAYFNDSSNGVAALPSELFSYAGRLGYTLPPLEPVKYLKPSGYFVYTNGRIKSIVDVAKVGPDYLPGHAHADTLSFELYVDGFPVLVNSGTSCYGNSNRRFYERCTKAHNTVEVHGQNSSEVWGAFRVARRAYLKNIEYKVSQESIELSAEHTGYLRCAKPVECVRTFKFSAHQLEITDSLRKNTVLAASYWHFHPGCSLSADAGGELTINSPSRQSLKLIRGAGEGFLVNDGLYAQEFGKLLASQFISFPVVNGETITIHY